MPGRRATISEFSVSFDMNDKPDSLPCRDNEIREIRQYIEANLNAGTSGCAYISGVPGTGKTASVRLIMQQLIKDRHLPPFEFVELNGLLISDSKRIYVEFYKALLEAKHFFSDKRKAVRISPPAAKKALDRLFELADKDRPAIVLLLDEVDGLITKRQQHLYQLFQWPNNEESKLTVLAISNTLDFAERSLSNRIQSRMGLKRLRFKPYDHTQINEILKCRFKQNPDAVEPDAAEYIARKVASVSGDIRRAFEICRIAQDLAKLDSSNGQASTTTTPGRKRKAQPQIYGPIKRKHADLALKKLAMNVKVQAIRRASTHEKLVLEAAVTSHGRVGPDEISFNRIWCDYQALCKERDIEQLTMDELLEVTNRLAQCNLLRNVTSPAGIGQDFTARYRLNVNPGDVNLALREE